ncbi:MAG: hypothetical protein VYE28_00310 [Planctomycetota bacterium]|nr:hypothetical protein [Planctomycetota bacterium]
MSKCNFEIVFDRTDRAYEAGEQVTGTLRLTVNKTINCRNVRVTARWKTHGRGNLTSGKYFTLNVHEGELLEGRQYEFPFEFEAATKPWTYRGHHLNIDHYVEARVDIAWAIDPKFETEFIVLPSPASPLEALEETPQGTTGQMVVQAIMMIAGTIFIAVGIPLTLFFGFGLIFMAVGAFLCFLVLRNFLAERKLGKVDLKIEPSHPSPEELLMVHLSFTPRSAGTLNNLTLTLAGQEVVVSGSGTNKTTHTHQLHEEKLVFLENFQLQPGSRVNFSEKVKLPASHAYSVALKDNQIAWEIKARLDIPQWPDWLDSRPFALSPKRTGLEQPKSLPETDTHHSTLAAESASAPPSDQTPTTTDSLATSSKLPEFEAENSESKEQIISAEVTDPSPASPASTSIELLQMIEQLTAADRFSNERDTLIEQHQGGIFTAVMEISRTTYTYGVFDEPDYRNGQTVSGTLSNSDQKISIQLPETDNELLDGLHSGETMVASGRVIKWDDLYNRIELRGKMIGPTPRQN